MRCQFYDPIWPNLRLNLRNMDKATCTECNDIVEGRKRCKNCKKNKYYQSKGVQVNTYCKSCCILTPTKSNGECRRCLHLAGLKECSVCHEIAVAALDFKERQGICRRCRHPLAHLTKKEQVRHAIYMKKYGLGYGEYMAMGHDQGWLCKICKRDKPLVVDHDHENGQIRGLLCGTCNTGLGMFQDCQKRLEAAGKYLTVQRELVVEEPKTRADAATEHQLKVALVKLEATKEELASTKTELHALKQAYRRIDPHLMRAIVTGAIRAVEHRLSPEKRVVAVKWLREVLQKI